LLLGLYSWLPWCVCQFQASLYSDPTKFQIIGSIFLVRRYKKKKAAEQRRKEQEDLEQQMSQEQEGEEQKLTEGDEVRTAREFDKSEAAEAGANSSMANVEEEEKPPSPSEVEP
jgi:hypothetical protein